ncbi:MAG TPA: M23 family metallopeptidase [Rubricoccaceae bacterium]
MRRSTLAARLPLLGLALVFSLSACTTTGGANGWAGRRTEGSRRETPRPAPRPLPTSGAPRPAPPVAEAPAPSPSGLLMPVVGVDPASLRDTFTDGRSGGRTHNAIDIAAPSGTPLVAVTDGEVRRMSWNALGGYTLYLRSADGRTDYYYAHLSRYALGLVAGRRVRRGDRLGDVGATGNARGPHLHFQVLDVSGGGRGTPVNPYGLFRTAEMAAR